MPLQNFKDLYVNLRGLHEVLVHLAGETYLVLGCNGSAREKLEIDLHDHFARGVLEDVFIVAAGNTLGDVPGEHDAGIVPAFLGFGYGIGLNAGSGALEASSLSGIRSLKACCGYGGSSKGSGKDQCEQTLHCCSPIVYKIDSFYL